MVYLIPIDLHAVGQGFEALVAHFLLTGFLIITYTSYTTKYPQHVGKSKLLSWLRETEGRRLKALHSVRR